MKSKIKNINCKIKEIIMIFIKKIRILIYKTLKKMPLILILSSSLIIMALTLYFLFIGDVNVLGEIIIYKFTINLNLLDILLSNISLLAAVLAIVIELKKPKLKVYFISNHGSLMNDKKGQVPIGIDGDGYIGYQMCIPSDWNMYLVNTGQRAAENIRVKISIDGVLFDHSLISKGYDLDNFMYGCGVFKNLNFDLVGLLRQGEKIELPRIPFEYCEIEDDSFKERKFTYLRISLYCNNQEPIQLKYKLTIKPYDFDRRYEYRKQKETQSFMETHINEMLKTYVDWYNINYNEEPVDVYNYYIRVNPYSSNQYRQIEQCKELFEYYLLKDNDKMIFWGRLYYQAMGMKLSDIEALLQTELIKEQVRKNKAGKFYI